MSRRGFTLLEMLAVLAILAVLSAFFVTKFGGRGRARLRQAEDLVVQSDAWARRLAEQRGEAVRLRVDVSGERVAVGKEGGSGVRALPTGVGIERVISQTEDRTRGEAVIEVDRRGASAAYAVRLRSPADEVRWVVFAGGTGQRFEMARSGEPGDETRSLRDQDVEAYFRALRKQARADAR